MRACLARVNHVHFMAQSKEMKKLIKMLEKVYFEIDEVIEKRVQANERYIINLNAAQMYRGEKADGTPILPSYAPSTILYKKKMGQPYNRVTLRDSGDFHFKELKVIAMHDKFHIDTSLSSQRPYDFLMKGTKKRAAYGEGVLGLNDKNIEKLFKAKLKKPLEKLFKTLKK